MDEALITRLVIAIERQNELLSRLENSLNPSPKLPLNEAWRVLGLKSPDSLRYRIKTGLYRLGKEYTDERSPGSQIPRYFFDLEACQKRDRTQSAKRKA